MKIANDINPCLVGGVKNRNGDVHYLRKGNKEKCKYFSLVVFGIREMTED